MKKIGTLKADFCSGYGELELTPDFRNSSPLFRADVLHDLITDLQEQYRVARDDMNREWRRARTAIAKAKGER